MLETEVVIIGAGVAGLVAARQLAHAGKQVIVVEARNRTGGRVFTNHDAAFSQPVELGAEFIHGKLKHTLALLKEYDITWSKVKGEIWQAQHGVFTSENDFIESSKLLNEPLRKLHRDMTVNEFLETLPKDEKHEELKYSVRKFVEGYDAADADKASALAFKKEWLEGEEEQYRVDGGYGLLVEALANDCRACGCRIVLNEIVKQVNWKKDRVVITTKSEEQFCAPKTLVTIPLGILQLPVSHKNHISFLPELPDKMMAVGAMGFGPVIKIALEFHEPFWKDTDRRSRIQQNLKKMNFLFTDTRIPTWWTQFPDNIPLLTGWIGGPTAKGMQHLSDEQLRDEALNAIVFLFRVSRDELDKKLKAWQVASWGADEFAHGAYSYTVVGAANAKKILAEPVDNTLFFAGESVYSGDETGMVEGAIGSGLETSAAILRTW